MACRQRYEQATYRKKGAPADEERPGPGLDDQKPLRTHARWTSSPSCPNGAILTTSLMVAWHRGHNTASVRVLPIGPTQK
jgi:hypothetical protein